MKRRNYRSYNPEEMNNEFQRVNWLPVLTAPNINIAVDMFNVIVKNIFDKHTPLINKKNLRNECNKIQRKAKASYHKNLINENRFNPKAFWKSVKNIFPTKNNKNKTTVNSEKDNHTKAEKFRDFLSTVVSKLKLTTLKLRDCVWKSNNLNTNRTVVFLNSATYRKSSQKTS